MESKKSMLVVMILGAAAVNVFVSAADPDPLRDFEGSEDLSNFVLRDVFKNGVVSNGPGGVRAAINTTLFPGITGGALLMIPDRSVATALNVGLDMIQKLKANMLLYSFRLKLAPPAVCVPGQNITTKI
ncbi:hypothetical protein SELMODRAFT_425729 [Selaginella moellendorffii]|uniref:FAS1 domain-containing protein n=1 Tax=Selaginella moellendorffii TaxID=88036 RepID=D8SU33_SELML|nr:hypothetical protein SELMODRAFT_425729 [Selaginella moellendorffii]